MATTELLLRNELPQAVALARRGGLLDDGAQPDLAARRARAQGLSEDELCCLPGLGLDDTWLDQSWDGEAGLEEAPGRAWATQHLLRQAEQEAEKYRKLAQRMSSLLQATNARRRSGWMCRPRAAAYGRL